MQQFAEFFLNHWDLFLMLAVILALLAAQGFGDRLRGFSSIEPAQAVLKMNHDDAVLVDVRDDNEFRDGHVVNAVHVPLTAFQQRIGELEKHKEKPIIVACRSGSRSARACGLLRKHGFEDVYNLRGGVLAWQNADLPLQSGRKRRKK